MAPAGVRMIALIPARAGSQRIPHKNIRELAGHPLIRYTIVAAYHSRMFSQILVSTDCPVVSRLAHDAGLEVRVRPARYARADSPDCQWITDIRAHFQLTAPLETFAILRPTSPFRSAETIRRAYTEFHTPDDTCDSLRAIQLVTEHPKKMWTCEGPGYPLIPLMPGTHPDGTPWHSSPTQTLGTYYIQNSSLEMGWFANLTQYGTIHGRKVRPFFTRGWEGFALDTPEQWAYAEYLVATGAVQLPSVDLAAAAAVAPLDVGADPGWPVSE